MNEHRIAIMQPYFFPYIAYRQFGTGFVPDLSIIDVMMFNSPEEISGLLKRYALF